MSGHPKTDLSQFNNSWYSPGGNSISRLLWFYTSILFFKSSFFPFYFLKRVLLRAFGAKIGRGLILKPGVTIKYPWRLKAGNHVWIGENAWIDNLADVSIGDHSCISQGALLLTGNHDYSKTSFDLAVKEIHLEEGVWIGAKSVICPGVTCRSHSVLSVGSIATKDMEADSVYAGNPAVKVRDRIIQ